MESSLVFLDNVLVLSYNVDMRQKYEKPTVAKVSKMTFPIDIITKDGKRVVCKQCSSCHGCR